MKNSILLLFTRFYLLPVTKKMIPHARLFLRNQKVACHSLFLRSHSINYMVDTNGIYYQVIDGGSGVAPNAIPQLLLRIQLQRLMELLEDQTTSSVTIPLTSLLKDGVSQFHIYKKADI